MLILPDGVLLGACPVSVSLSKMTKFCGTSAHVSAVLAPAVLLTLVKFKSNSVPEPDSGVKSVEKAEMRNVLTAPTPKTFAEMVQLPEVSPALDTAGFWTLT